MTDEFSSARVSAAARLSTSSWRSWIPSTRIPRAVIYVYRWLDHLQIMLSRWAANQSAKALP